MRKVHYKPAPGQDPGGIGLGLLDGASDCSVSGAVGGALLSLRVAAAGAVDTLTTRGAIFHITLLDCSSNCKHQAKEMKPAHAVTSLSPFIVKRV